MVEPTAEPTTWVDRAPIDPDWPPPVDPDDQRRRRLIGWLPVGIPVLVAILVIALVAAFGGFKQRTDQLIRLETGTTFEAGPYAFTFERATIQLVEGFGEAEKTQEVLVYGTVSNTWTQAIIPDSGQFAASDLAGTQFQGADYVGLSSSLTGPSYLTPGLPAQEIQIEFEFPENFDPRDELRFVTSDLTYGDHSFLGVGNEETWYNDGDRFLQHLPLTRLADEEN